MWKVDELKGRLAVITGGSEGLGRVFCRVLCEAGCEVYFCSRNAERGRKVAQSLGVHAHYFQTDLTVPEEICAFAARVREWAGKVDYLVNNAANDDRIEFREVTVQACGKRPFVFTIEAY
jgi:NAD(P)-dependent dehydrogenase (short-subunit alcohol dehydrogenase family)